MVGTRFFALASLCAMMATNQANAGVVRQVLPDYDAAVGGSWTLLKGEIAYQSKHEGAIAYLAGSTPTVFSVRPPLTALAMTSFYTDAAHVYVSANTKVNATDGTTIPSACNTSYSLTAINSATALNTTVPGWNYLWLAVSGTTCSIYATNGSVAPALPTGVTYDHIGYLGAVEAQYSYLSSSNVFLPIKKSGSRYTFLSSFAPYTGAAVLLNSTTMSYASTLPVPYTAINIHFLLGELSTGSPTLVSAPTGAKVCFYIGSTSQQDCTFDQGETDNSTITFSHTATSTENSVAAIESFEESLDKMR